MESAIMKALAVICEMKTWVGREEEKKGTKRLSLFKMRRGSERESRPVNLVRQP